MKRIELPHKVCPVTCMVNGLEDLYEQKTGVRLPDRLLLFLSGITGFVYIKNKQAPAQRMVFWGSNIARHQYETLAGVIGYQWQMVTDLSFAATLKRVEALIDQGTPPLLGILDMYHLPYYEKFYHKFHVPIHHVLMVGYDRDSQVVLVQDCDRAEVLAVPYTDLEQAWNLNIPGLGKKNTFYTFAFNEQVADVATIARKGLQKRAAEMLHPPVSMFGLPAMRKLARELPEWPAQFTPAQLEASLCHLVEFTGYPPVMPNRLTGQQAPDNHAAGREFFAQLLRDLAGQFDEPGWARAAECFDRSGLAISGLTDTLVDYLLGQPATLEGAAGQLREIAAIEEEGFTQIYQACGEKQALPA